jgi:putative ABC transport system permease protein
MIGVALRGLLGRKLRAVLTAFAIVLGVAMISGSFVLTDTLSKSFDGIYEESYKVTDAVVSSKQAVKTGDGDAEAPAFSADVLDEIERLPGARVVQGSIEDEARLIDRAGNPIGNVDEGLALAVDTSADQSLNPFQLVQGEWPSGDGQIAIDRSTAEKQDFRIGQTVGVLADGPVATYRITGIIGFGSVDSIGGSTITVFDLPTAGRVFDKAGKLDLIRVGAEPGTTQAELVRQISPLLSETTQVKSAEAQAAADSKDTQDGMSLIKYMLIGFGGIALFVGSFVIANTLAITVAQRMRELATLRTLGASRRQVLGSVVLESVVIGLIGSLAGLFLGLGIAVGLIKLLEATGVELPSSGLVFAPRTILVSLGVGTLIALLASLRPAIRATRIEPIAAVREGSVMPSSRFARYAVFTSAVVFAAALGLFSYGVFASGLDIVVRIATLVLGVLLMFVSVAMIASRVVRPLALVLGTPGARLGGAAGRLARQNAVRNPSRTASTAAAVMIGLALITFVAVIGQGVRTSFTGAVNELFVADYALSAGFEPVSDKAAQAAATTPGVAVSEIRGGDAKLDGKTIHVTGVDGNLSRVVNLTWSSGSGDVPAQLGRDGAFVTDRFAESNSLELGSPLSVKTPTGTTLALRVEGILDEPKGGSPFGDGVAISKATFDDSFASRDNDLTLLNIDGGTNEANTALLERSIAAFPDVEVDTRDEFKDRQLGDLTTMLNMLYLLLGLSVVVSLFGVINTLVLSVFERTRELGMLRAIGMTRRQVRRMIRHESIVTALIGAALGIGVGMFLAVITTLALSDYGVVFAVPYGTLTVFVGVAILAGMLAAILPARRASRLNVLEALQYE